MTPRSLFEVAIRIFGALCFFTTASQIAQLVVAWFAGFFGWENLHADMEFYVAQQLTGTVFTGILGLVLFSYAPQIASMVYPYVDEDEDDRSPESRVTEKGFGPVDVYKVIIVVFGLYLLAQSVEPLSSIVVAFFIEGVNPFSQIWDSQITQVLVNTAVGVSLIFGAGRFAILLAADPYENMEMPKPKLSVALVVVIFFLLAVLIAVVRLLMFSHS